MSVIAYTRDEVLAAISATWNRGSIGSSDAIRHMDNLADFANKLMAANMNAYDHTYNERSELEQPITGRDIKMALVRNSHEEKMRGMRCLNGLRYNLIANDGRDFADAEILDGLLGMFKDALSIVNRRAEVA